MTLVYDQRRQDEPILSAQRKGENNGSQDASRTAD